MALNPGHTLSNGHYRIQRLLGRGGYGFVYLAQDTHLGNHTTTLAAEYAKKGLDWEEELRQRARELKLMRRLGLTTVAVPALPGADDDAADEDEKEDAESAANAAAAV